MKPWRLLVAGQVVSEDPRHIVLRDAVFNHLAHHRGQLTVSVRLNGAPVPSIYGPSADERLSRNFPHGAILSGASPRAPRG
jgi:uncharacterized damage-inducible protein DinB